MTATALQTQAPGKVNLCLYLGPTREDGYHELLSLVQPVSLCDTVALGPAGAGAAADEVVCEGVEGPNLAGRALAAFREATGWDAPPQRVTITKEIPVAAGMGGGSSDAAATLRLAVAASGLELDLASVAFGLGADVPALLHASASLVGGAGEDVEPIGSLEPLVLVVVPSTEQLSTPAVFAEADRLGLPRENQALHSLRDDVAAAARTGLLAPELMNNDLEPAAISLCPSIGDALERLRELGAATAMVSGSGPTVFGVLPGGIDEADVPPPGRVVGPYAELRGP